LRSSDEYQGTIGQCLRLAQAVDYELEVAQAWVEPQERRGLLTRVNPEVLLSLPVNRSALLAEFLELGRWRASARLPPRTAFCARKDPRNVRATTAAQIVANNPFMALERATLLNSLELGQQ
jgi:hypothetical protein